MKKLPSLLRTFAVLLIVLVVFITSPASYALTYDDIQAIQNSTYNYDPKAIAGGSCSTSAGATIITATAQGLGPTQDGHTLPAAAGGVGEEEAAVLSGGRAVLAPGTSHPGAGLALAPSGMTDRDAQFYITMRWRYAVWGWNGTSQKGPEDVSWYSQAVRKVKITNTANGKSVVASILEAGPAPYTGTKEGTSAPSYWQGFIDGTPDQYDGRVAGLSPDAFRAIESSGLEWVNGHGDKVNFEWVDGATPSGTVSGGDGGSVAASEASTDGPTCGSASGGTVDLSSFVVYNQYDPKWINHPFGSSTIGDSGCGPSSVAMVVTNLTGQAVTPIDTADFGTSNGGYIAGAGSSYQKMLVEGPEHWGLKVKALSSISEAVSALRGGALVIAAGTGALPYTGAGHVIVLRGVTSDGKILVGDSAHPEANKTAFEQSVITAGNSGLWAVTK